MLPSSRNISPLSAGQEFYTTRFTSEEIKNLFTQYVEENKLNVDVDEIVADIYSLTLGHKGLVGICCSAAIILRLISWLALTKQISVTGKSIL